VTVRNTVGSKRESDRLNLYLTENTVCRPL